MEHALKSTSPGHQVINSTRPVELELISAPYTPFLPSGKINLGVVAPYAELLIRQGVSGVFICGTTGEGVSLTCQERMELCAEWVRQSRGLLQVIVHTGHSCLTDSIALAMHAERVGADAIAAVGPTFFIPPSASPLIKYLSSVSDQTDLPFYYYHLPSKAHFFIPVSDWLNQAREEVRNLRGVKYTHTDVDDFEKCLKAAGDDFKIFFGVDQKLLEALERKATAAVGSTYNFAAQLYLDIYAAYSNGDQAEAERLQVLSFDFVQVLLKYGIFGASKAIMTHLGVSCGQPRLPLPELAPQQEEKLLTDLADVGILPYFPCSLL